MNIKKVAQAAAKKVEHAAKQVHEKATEGAATAKEAFDATRPQRQVAQDVFDMSRPVREYAFSVARSDAAWGRSVTYDTGTVAPNHQRYGVAMKTLGEVSTPKLPGQPKNLELLGARGRLFGEVSKETLSMGIGVEGEVGAKVAGREKGNIEGKDGFYGELFVGSRTRHATEVGVLGLSAGTDNFFGAEAYAETNSAETYDSDFRFHTKAHVQLGARAAARVAFDPVRGFSAQQRQEVGLRARAQAQSRSPLAGPVGVLTTVEGNAFVGMTEGLRAKFGPSGAEAGGEFFIGARAALNGRVALEAAGIELLGVGGQLEGYVGVGVEGRVGFGYDSDTRRINAKVEAGAALGIGAGVELETTIAGDELFAIAGGGPAAAQGAGGSASNGERREEKPEDNLKGTL